jgi:hypothetical protein
MRLSYSATEIVCEEGVLLQYESLRSQVLRKPGALPERNLGLALFVRQGMLAWIETCHQCMSAHATLDNQTEAPVAPYETRSEMIRVLANMTLLNLEEASS